MPCKELIEGSCLHLGYVFTVHTPRATGWGSFHFRENKRCVENRRHCILPLGFDSVPSLPQGQSSLIPFPWSLINERDHSSNSLTMLVTFSRALNWGSQQMAGKTHLLFIVRMRLLNWFFQESHVDKSSHHAILCTFAKSLFCSRFNFQMVKRLRWNILLFLSLRYNCTLIWRQRELYYKLSSDNVDMRLGRSAKTWKLIHLSVILWIKNWIVERALRFFLWTCHLFIVRVILGFLINYSEL